VLLAVGAAVKPDEHRRVGTVAAQQLAEISEGVAAEQLVLIEHEGNALNLVVAGGKVAVPEQRQLLAQRIGAVEDAVQPPCLEALRVIRVEDALAQKVEDLSFVLGRLGGAQEPVNAGGGAVLQVALQLAPGRAEAGPPVQMGRLAQVPRVGRSRVIGRPRPELAGHGSTSRVIARARSRRSSCPIRL
jgi:hypothetical protein